MIWLLASENNGQVCDDKKKLAFRFRVSESFINKHLGSLSHWLEYDDITMISQGYQHDPQEKEKEKEKEEDIACDITPSNGKGKYGEQGLVLLTDIEVEKLKIRFGEDKAAEYVEKLDAYIGSKGKKYKSHFSTILSWSMKESTR